MGLADALKSLEVEPICKMGAIIEGLDPETREVLLRVFDGKASTRSITEALNREGYKVGKTSVGLHRVGQCSCGGTDEPV